MLLSKQEILQKYNINNSTLNNWIKLGLNIKNNKYIDKNELENFIKNNNKLLNRKNRINNNKYIIPSEFKNYINNFDVFDELNLLLQKHNKKNIIENLIINRIETIIIKNFKNKQYKEYLKGILKKLNIKRTIDIKLEDNNLITGILYQYLIGIKEQSKKGIYYTTLDIIKKLIPEKFKLGTTFLDPACGSGFILFEIFKKYKKLYKGINPLKYIYGNDIDYYSTLIAKIELIELAKNETEFIIPNIYNLDGLELDDKIKNIDYIITNPPYGAKIKNKELENITGTKESFIYFLYKSINNYTKKNGKINMVLPISILTTLSYKNNRIYLLENGLYKIEFLGKKFKGVLSDIVLLYIDKEKSNIDIIEYIKKDKIKKIPKKIIYDNKHFIINEYQTEENYKKYKKLLQEQHFYLEPEYFYLGIVTGNNSKKIKNKKDKIYNQEVILGKNFDNNNKFYINPNDNFQQVPKNIEVYKRNKIVYKFISNKIKTKTDFEGKYTINSVNIYAPKNKSKKELINISKQLNSDTSDFILKFLYGNVNKILKEHLTSIPIFNHK